MTEETQEPSRRGRKSREQITSEMVESAEFKSLLSAGIAEGVATAMAQLAPHLEAARGKAIAGRDDGSMMQELAMAISELTTQGTGRVRVSPEVLMRREQAREKMMGLITEARAEKKVPTYRLRHKIYLNERLIEPFWQHPATKAIENTEIDFWGIPNDAMVPVNDAAKEIYEAYRDSIGIVHGARGVSNLLPPEDKLSVTQNGLVIRNSANAAMNVHSTPERPVFAGPMKSAYEEGDKDSQPLVIKQDARTGQYKDVAVLGTIAPPARQSA